MLKRHFSCERDAGVAGATIAHRPATGAAGSHRPRLRGREQQQDRRPAPAPVAADRRQVARPLRAGPARWVAWTSHAPGVPRTVTDAQVEQVVVATLETTPPGTTHWSTYVARATGMSRMTISRIWRAFGLRPHRSETFKLSPDPLLIEKARDIVGRLSTRPTMPSCCYARTQYTQVYYPLHIKDLLENVYPVYVAQIRPSAVASRPTAGGLRTTFESLLTSRQAGTTRGANRATQAICEGRADADERRDAG